MSWQFSMSRLLKKSLNNDKTKMNKKEGKFTDKSGRVLSNNFWSALFLIEPNDYTRVLIPGANMNSTVHSQFFVLVVMNFMTEMFHTVDSWV